MNSGSPFKITRRLLSKARKDSTSAKKLDVSKESIQKDNNQSINTTNTKDTINTTNSINITNTITSANTTDVTSTTNTYNIQKTFNNRSNRNEIRNIAQKEAIMKSFTYETGNSNEDIKNTTSPNSSINFKHITESNQTANTFQAKKTDVDVIDPSIYEKRKNKPVQIDCNNSELGTISKCISNDDLIRTNSAPEDRKAGNDSETNNNCIQSSPPIQRDKEAHGSDKEQDNNFPKISRSDYANLKLTMPTTNSTDILERRLLLEKFVHSLPDSMFFHHADSLFTKRAPHSARSMLSSILKKETSDTRLIQGTSQESQLESASEQGLNSESVSGSVTSSISSTQSRSISGSYSGFHNQESYKESPLDSATKVHTRSLIPSSIRLNRSKDRNQSSLLTTAVKQPKKASSLLTSSLTTRKDTSTPSLPIRKLLCERLIYSFITRNKDYKLWYLKTKFNKERSCVTKPSDPDQHNPVDNQNGDLLISLGDVLLDRYFVIDLLGTGTFGIVIKCEDLKTGKLSAVKVIKNREAYTRQAEIEYKILIQLKRYKPNSNYIVELEDRFKYKNHLCFVFELLNINLYELLVQNRYQGLKWITVRAILKQMLEAMLLLQTLGILHCDLKPENVLLTNDISASSDGPSEVGENSSSRLIKIIDFGSACYEGDSLYSYIQSRFYRSPEVLLGMRYTGAIDIWSLGCIATELYLGLPIFPGHSQHNQLWRIIQTLGCPPSFMIENSKYGRKYFHPKSENGDYVLKTEEEFCREFGGIPQESKRYFKFDRIEDLIMNYNRYDTETSDGQRRALIHFIHGCLTWNPFTRWTADQAIEHPIFKDQETCEKFTSWIPPASTKVRRIPQYTPTLPSYVSTGTPTMASYISGYGSVGSHYQMPTVGPSPNLNYQFPQISSYSPKSGGFNVSSSYGSANGSFPNSGSFNYPNGFTPIGVSPQIHNFVAYSQQQGYLPDSPSVYPEAYNYSYGSPQYASPYINSYYSQAGVNSSLTSVQNVSSGFIPTQSPHGYAFTNQTQSHSNMTSRVIHHYRQPRQRDQSHSWTGMENLEIKKKLSPGQSGLNLGSKTDPHHTKPVQTVSTSHKEPSDWDDPLFSIEDIKQPSTEEIDDSVNNEALSEMKKPQEETVLLNHSKSKIRSIPNQKR